VVTVADRGIAVGHATALIARSFIQKINEFYLIYLSESDSPKFLSDSRIHEFNQRSFMRCIRLAVSERCETGSQQRTC
ncbi:hypothetical protein J8J20_25880, partial [Mycobacterium tuberculosis]|nr:hypothetical protein [Mycobacterium tuberculosis]